MQKEVGHRKATEVLSYLRELAELQIIRALPLESSVVYRLPILVENYGLSFVDALVVATALDTKSTLVTRDEKLQKVEELDVKTPDGLV